MNFRDYYLWAGLVLLCLDLYHFLRQRKGYDRNTIFFLHLSFLSIGVCVLGILITAAQNQLLPLGHWPVMFLATGLYLIQTALPYTLLRFTATRLGHDRDRQKRVDRWGLLALLPGMALILLNVPFDLISRVSEDGFLRVCSLAPLYTGGMLLYYLFDMAYIWTHRRELGRRNWNALTETCAIFIAGLIAQHYLHIQLFFGFAAALAVFILHLTLKNPYAYMDITTHVFNAEYFQTWMAERLEMDEEGILIVLDFYQLGRAVRLYMDGTGSRLAVLAAEFLWSLEERRPHVFRLTPSRFVLWTDSDAKAEELLRRCMERLEKPFSAYRHSIRCPAVLVKLPLDGTFSSVSELTAYLGFCTCLADGQGTVQVIRDSPSLRERFADEAEIERFLMEALEQDLFQVWYQPVYSLKEKRFVSLEVLSRLYHPKLGWISPERFIQIAAHAGLLSQIMPQQLRKVCRFAKDHAELFSSLESIKLNLSPQELSEPDYCENLLTIIRESELPPSKFQFEVTESTATQYSLELEACIWKLQEAGVGLCLDDFGSGYANLNTVLRLPFSVIKLDRSLLMGICQDEAAAVFYRGLVKLLKNLGYTVIAEGVETEQEAGFLAQWDVEQIQGYYFSRPLPPEQVMKLGIAGRMPISIEQRKENDKK